MSPNSTSSKLIRLAGYAARSALRNRRGLRAILGNALATSERIIDPLVDVTALPEVTIESVAEQSLGDITLCLRTLPSIGSSITLIEAVAVATLMRSIDARRVFEFGTYRGVSTTQLALNIAPGGEVFTLDLPPDDPRTEFDLRTRAELDIAHHSGKGDLIPLDLRERITFLHQDSARFDPTPYANSMDFVFIDGAHTPEYVENDSKKGWKMLRPAGIVAWHDCRHNSPGVARFLLESSWKPKRLAGGTIAFAVK